jgi:hypothetical protein
MMWSTHSRRIDQISRTFLRAHAPDIAAMDLFVVPTVGFALLYAFVIVRLDRRDLVWINVTVNSTAEWVARQITEAFPWNDVNRLPTLTPHWKINQRLMMPIGVRTPRRITGVTVILELRLRERRSSLPRTIDHDT